MNISDFTNQEFIDVIKVNNPSYIVRNGEKIDPIIIKDIKRADDCVFVTATQLFVNKYLLKKFFRFSNKRDLTIKSEMLDNTFTKDGWLDYSDYYTPIFRMISKNEQHKGNDWLSRLSKYELYYFANKYIFPCDDINIEARENSKHHCKDIFFKDKEGYIFQATCFGDYGIYYAKHAHTLSKLDISQIFNQGDMEFYNLMIGKLNHMERIEYAKNFINEHMKVYVKQHSNNANFKQELEKGKIIAENLMNLIKSENKQEQTNC